MSGGERRGVWGESGVYALIKNKKIIVIHEATVAFESTRVIYVGPKEFKTVRPASWVLLCPALQDVFELEGRL